MYITPTGKRYEGVDAFVYWCNERGFDPNKKIGTYIKILKKYNKIKMGGLFDVTNKLRKTFGKKVCANKLFYIDFYSIEIFGKTKLGQMLLYAKQGQNRKEMKKIVLMIKDNVEKLIKREQIDSVVFVPPTVKREYQFMKFIEKELNLSIPKIKVLKKVTDIAVPQKTLKKLQDRIENANNTFLVKDNAKFKKTLIIDDAVGSGSTINQISCKLKENGNSKNIIGLSIVGSLNDFEVISEV